MVPDAAVAHDLVPEDDQPEVVDILAVVLLHVHSGKRGGVLQEREGEEDEKDEEDEEEEEDEEDVAPVHVHEDVPDHDHGGLVVVPGSVEGL